MFKALLMILDLDGYTSLWNKFHDHSGMTYGEHRWVADKWEEVMWQMIKRVKLGRAWKLRAAWYCNDWEAMYEIILEWLQIEDVVRISNYV